MRSIGQCNFYTEPVLVVARSAATKQPAEPSGILNSVDCFASLLRNAFAVSFQNNPPEAGRVLAMTKRSESKAEKGE